MLSKCAQIGLIASMLIDSISSTVTMMESYTFYSQKDANSLPFANFLPFFEKAPSNQIDIVLTQVEGSVPVSGYIASNVFQYKPPRAHAPNLCVQNKALRHRPHNMQGTINTHDFSFPQSELNGQVKHFRLTKDIPASGLFVTIVQVCSHHDAQALGVAAEMHPINPFGHLAGDKIWGMPFTALSCIVFGVGTLAWLHSMLKYPMALLPHHWLIFIGLILSTVESVLHLTYLKQTNTTAHPKTPTIVMHASITIILAVYARVIVSLASSGWGIATPYLSKLQVGFITLFSILYVTIYAVVKFHELNYLLHDGVYHPYIGSLFLLSLLDGGIIWWIFETLSVVLETLHLQNQYMKLALYRRFGIVLFSFCGASFISVFVLAEFFRAQRFSNAHMWGTFWFLREGIWRTLFMLTLLSTAYLWRPQKNSKAYAYSEQIPIEPSVAEQIEKDMVASANFDSLNLAEVKGAQTPRFTISTPKTEVSSAWPGETSLDFDTNLDE